MPERVPAALEFAEKSLRDIDLVDTFNIPPENRRMGEALVEYLGRGGKYLRPAIVFSTIKAYGVTNVINGLWAALSIQLDHNYFLIHDDQEDRSYLRRGKPTMHILYGEDFAINYGDYLRCLAEDAMYYGSDIWDDRTFKRLTRARNEMLRATSEGQDLEFQLRSRPLSEMTEGKILRILINKTAVYTTKTGHRYGSIISGLLDSQIDLLETPLINIGMAFQIQDDSLDLAKPKEEEKGEATLVGQKFGKDWAGDLEEVKRTMPLLELYRRASEDERQYIHKKLDIDGEMPRLAKMRYELRRRGLSDDDPELQRIVAEMGEIKLRILEMMDSKNVIKDSQARAKKLYDENIPQIESALPDTENKKELLELLHFAVFRKF